MPRPHGAGRDAKRQARRTRIDQRMVHDQRIDRQFGKACLIASTRYSERRKFSRSCFCDELSLLKLLTTWLASEAHDWLLPPPLLLSVEMYEEPPTQLLPWL